MAENADALGLPRPFPIGREMYDVICPSPEMRGLFEKWMRIQAWREAINQKEMVEAGVMSEADFILNKQSANELILSKHFSWDTKAFLNNVMSPAGRVHLLWLGIVKHRPGFTEEQAEALFAAHAADCHRIIGWLIKGPDPNASAAGKAPPAA